MTDLTRTCETAGKDLGIFVVSYTLAPGAQYPTQLSQSVEALRHILLQTRRKPADILIGGDSAGGNLALGVLSHLAHPHPDIEALNVPEPLAGTALMAPWTLLDEDPKVKSNCIGDLLTSHVAAPWANSYLGTAERHYYTDASTAPPTWFSTFPVQQILILAGQNEIMLPLIEDFVKILEVRSSRDFYIEQRKLTVFIA